jgi:hypothetical protein
MARIGKNSYTGGATHVNRYAFCRSSESTKIYIRR